MAKFQKVQGLDLNSLPKNLEFPEVESRLQENWTNEKIYAYDESSSKPTFAIDTPPPTVSGSLHVGHIFSYTQTDIMARYQRMLGKNVFYPMGWDDNGLPTERRVQNFFHIRCDANQPYEPGLDLPPILSTMTDKELQEKRVPQRNLSRRNFIEHCHKLTVEDEKAFKKLWSRIGLSVDWSLEYATIDDHSRKIAQLSFLDMQRKGVMYQVQAPTLWDCDFQTAVAQAELEDRELPGAFHDIEFAVEGGGSFTIATTRPELLPACVGVTCHPDDERYKHLIGKKAITPLFGAPVPIFASELVQMDKGTGILMVCTFGDQTDVIWWRENKLATRQVIGKAGLMIPVEFVARDTAGAEFPSVDPATANASYAKIQGRNVKQAQKLVVEMLGQPDARGTVALKQVKPLQHAVKFYEKGDRPVEFLITRQWFARLLDKKEKLLEFGSKIKWHPEFMEVRYRNWTENLGIDWCVSRQRFFGVSIPVWYPLDQNGQPVYEKPMFPTEEQLPVDPMSDAPKGYTETQRNQPGGFVGESDVFDTWFTSSLTPQLGSHWTLNPARHKKLFPMDLRPQAHEIIRTWAFYTIAKAMIHDQEIPWKHIAISGWVLDPDRKKMSKSKGNTVTPAAHIDEFGADAVRYWSGLARYGSDTAFDTGIMKIGRRLAMKIFNASKFALQSSAEAGDITEPLDLAFLTKLRAQCEQATKSFETWEPASALMETEKFFWTHFTDSYVELIKSRSLGEKTTEEERRAKASAVHTARLAVKTFLKLFAPFLPYTTDEVWRWAFTDEAKSVHQARYPTAADFAGIGEGRPELFDTAMAAQATVNQAKTNAKVSIARAITQIRLKAHPDTIKNLTAVQGDICGATKIEKLALIEDSTQEKNAFTVEHIEFGPDLKA
jgi:valyl-tRNA synthetase